MLKTVPLDLDPGMVATHRVRDPITKEHVVDPTLDRLVSAASLANVKAEGLYELAQAISADAGMAGHAARLAFATTATKAYNEANAKLADAMRGAFADLNAQQRTMTPAAPATFLATEIRSRLATMKAEERSQVLADADDATMGALANGPYWLSGVSKAVAELHLHTWRQRRFPEESERVRRLGRALDATRRIVVSFEAYVLDLQKAMATPAVAAAKRTEAAQQVMAAE